MQDIFPNVTMAIRMYLI